MTGLRGGDHHLAAPSVRFHRHAVAYALAAGLAVALTVLVLVLAGSGDTGGSAEPVRVAPSAGQAPPQQAEPPVVKGRRAQP